MAFAFCRSFSWVRWNAVRKMQLWNKDKRDVFSDSVSFNGGADSTFNFNASDFSFSNVTTGVKQEEPGTPGLLGAPPAAAPQPQPQGAVGGEAGGVLRQLFDADNNNVDNMELNETKLFEGELFFQPLTTVVWLKLAALLAKTRGLKLVRLISVKAARQGCAEKVSHTKDHCCEVSWFEARRKITAKNLPFCQVKKYTCVCINFHWFTHWNVFKWNACLTNACDFHDRVTKRGTVSSECVRFVQVYSRPARRMRWARTPPCPRWRLHQNATWVHAYWVCENSAQKFLSSGPKMKTWPLIRDVKCLVPVFYSTFLFHISSVSSLAGFQWVNVERFVAVWRSRGRDWRQWLRQRKW